MAANEILGSMVVGSANGRQWLPMAHMPVFTLGECYESFGVCVARFVSFFYLLSNEDVYKCNTLK